MNARALELGIDARRQVGTIERQEADHIRKCLLCEASEKLHGWLREASNSQRSQCAKHEIALCNDRCHYVVDRRDRNHRCRRIDKDRGGNDRRPSYGASTEIGAIVIVVSKTIVVATTAAPPTERRSATIANARLVMGIALATISLERGNFGWLRKRWQGQGLPVQNAQLLGSPGKT